MLAMTVTGMAVRQGKWKDYWVEMISSKSRGALPGGSKAAKPRSRVTSRP